jgi:SPX domain protein involved in polyphosphate accumulation
MYIQTPIQHCPRLPLMKVRKEESAVSRHSDLLPPSVWRHQLRSTNSVHCRKHVPVVTSLYYNNNNFYYYYYNYYYYC